MTPTPTSGAADLLAMVSKALREAYNLGQRYWQQADSEYISQHKKADDTRAKFLALVEETCAALAAGQATAAQGFRDGVASVSAGWQSIETAPKDGQAILVTDGMNCYCVEWDEEFDWWTVDDNKLGPFRLRGSAPTHWMPTPAAPGPADGESNG